ncbi:MAG: peptide chain release factor N(5)-glutamine methyltransferase [Desulfobacteraceae bacterium]|nr:peptide chain release factor N(5)-glutamine methyltransferase [Desulfobacteraceae bacterium]
MTQLELYRHALSGLAAAGIAEPEAEAVWLLCHLLGCRRAELFLNAATEVGEATRQRVEAALARRRAREPLAYILGEQNFYGRDFTVSPAVLIPRPETELLVERALARLPPSGQGPVLDLGTGSGIIAVTLAAERPGLRAVGLDRSLAALKVAQMNALRHHVAARIAWLNSDWDAALGPAKFTLIAANPPYVARREAATLQAELAAEPETALFSGEDGREDIDRLLSCVHRLLAPGGTLLMEIGHDQGDYVAKRARKLGHYQELTVREDYAGLPRLLEARRRP